MTNTRSIQVVRYFGAILAVGLMTAFSAPPASGAASHISVAQAKAQLKQLEGKQKFPALPTSPKPKSNEKVFVICYWMAIPGLAQESNGAVAAAKSLGWNVTLVDGGGDPATITQGVQRAISEHATGIILATIPSAIVGENALADARAAGIPIVSMNAENIPSPTGVSAEVYSATFDRGTGADEALWAIAHSNGKAHVLVLNDTSFASAAPVYQGTMNTLRVCAGCKAYTLNFVGANIATTVASAVTTALETHPDINYVAAEYDAVALAAGQGIKSSGRSGIGLLSTGGNASNLNNIRAGSQAMDSGEPLAYNGWYGVWVMNWLLNGKSAPTTSNTAGFGPNKVLYAGNLPPKGQPWNGDEDFTPTFTKSWG